MSFCVCDAPAAAARSGAAAARGVTRTLAVDVAVSCQTSSLSASLPLYNPATDQYPPRSLAPPHDATHHHHHHTLCGDDVSACVYVYVWILTMCFVVNLLRM